MTFFTFAFPEGVKRSDEMTRDDLLRVIEHMKKELDMERERHYATLSMKMMRRSAE